MKTKTIYEKIIKLQNEIYKLRASIPSKPDFLPDRNGKYDCSKCPDWPCYNRCGWKIVNAGGRWPDPD